MIHIDYFIITTGSNPKPKLPDLIWELRGNFEFEEEAEIDVFKEKLEEAFNISYPFISIFDSRHINRVNI